MKALGYVRVSTADQGESGAGLEAQRAAIENEADRRLWELVEIHQDVASGASTRKRPELANALQRLEQGEAQALIVARLSRLARSTKDILYFIERADEQGWKLIPLDYPEFDTTRAIGKLLVTIVAAVDQFQRELGAENTSDALQALKAQGVVLGRPVLTDESAEAHIDFMVSECGKSYGYAAEWLNREGIKPPIAAEWSPRSVWSVYQRVKGDGKLREMVS